MASLLDLPPNVVSLVVSCASRPALLTLRATCQRLKEEATRQ